MDSIRAVTATLAPAGGSQSPPRSPHRPSRTVAADPRRHRLRQYTRHPGRRDDLVALFEREFAETEEAEGIRLIGQFLNLDDPDRFVWFRGFPDMAGWLGPRLQLLRLVPTPWSRLRR